MSIRILKNLLAASVALFVAFPLVIFFDISINGYFNPSYGIWSQSFLNGWVALVLSGISFVLAILAPMEIHSYIIKKLHA
ncbi:hypothetical protein [Vibrio marisflavi]|uniref:DUF2798 domain-containing protein n=1 Tax=Vibrio marisflavi CECT 7928 TaxID=634439 RepID=A0ABN8E1W6_9VIBR|nr:hypothetical protein [Vibrio marisflavi]CAH0537305.1 hypothetical protein VMF7928_01043 [Vibrio marisflavi CECT 7928]